MRPGTTRATPGTLPAGRRLRGLQPKLGQLVPVVPKELRDAAPLGAAGQVEAARAALLPAGDGGPLLAADAAALQRAQQPRQGRGRGHWHLPGACPEPRGFLCQGLGSAATSLVCSKKALTLRAARPATRLISAQRNPKIPSPSAPRWYRPWAGNWKRAKPRSCSGQGDRDRGGEAVLAAQQEEVTASEQRAGDATVLWAPGARQGLGERRGQPRGAHQAVHVGADPVHLQHRPAAIQAGVRAVAQHALWGRQGGSHG